MKRDTKILTAVGAIIAVSVIGFFAYLANAGTMDQSPAKGKLAEKLAQLGVTDEQKAQVKEILKKYQPTVQPLVKQFVVEHRALRDLIHAESVDETAIRAQVEKVAKVGADLAVQCAHVSHEIRAVLTPDQIQKLKDMKVDLDTRIDEGLARIAKRIAED